MASLLRASGAVSSAAPVVDLDARRLTVVNVDGRDRWNAIVESLANPQQQHIVLLNRNVAHEDFRDYLVTSHQAILDALRDGDEPRALAILPVRRVR